MSDTLDHPCKATCSGWKQGYERGSLDASLQQAREITHVLDRADLSGIRHEIAYALYRQKLLNRAERDKIVHEFAVLRKEKEELLDLLREARDTILGSNEEWARELAERLKGAV